MRRKRESGSIKGMNTAGNDNAGNAKQFINKFSIAKKIYLKTLLYKDKPNLAQAIKR